MTDDEVMEYVRAADRFGLTSSAVEDAPAGRIPLVVLEELIRGTTASIQGLWSSRRVRTILLADYRAGRGGRSDDWSDTGIVAHDASWSPLNVRYDCLPASAVTSQVNA